MSLKEQICFGFSNNQIPKIRNMQLKSRNNLSNRKEYSIYYHSFRFLRLSMLNQIEFQMDFMGREHNI